MARSKKVAAVPASTAKPDFDQTRYETLLKTAQRLAIIHNLLGQGMFQGNARKDLNEAIPFVEEMHKGVMVELEPLMAEKERLDEAVAAAAAQAEAEVSAVEQVVAAIAEAKA